MLERTVSRIWLLLSFAETCCLEWAVLGLVFELIILFLLVWWVPFLRSPYAAATCANIFWVSFPKNGSLALAISYLRLTYLSRTVTKSFGVKPWKRFWSSTTIGGGMFYCRTDWKSRLFSELFWERTLSVSGVSSSTSSLFLEGLWFGPGWRCLFWTPNLVSTVRLIEFLFECPFLPFRESPPETIAPPAYPKVFT